MASNLKVDIVRPTATNGSLSLKGDSGGSATANGVTVDSSGDTTITGTTTVSQLNAADGAEATPSITNTGDTNTGIYFPAADTVGISTDGTERMRIDSSGHVIVPNGVTLGTAAGTYAAANTLDDYEEGTWTCSVVGQSATATGRYVKIGELVHVEVFFSCDTTVTTTVAGSLISGLPFPASTSTRCYLNFWAFNLKAVSGANGAPTISASVGPPYVEATSTVAYVRPASSTSGNPYYFENIFNSTSKFYMNGTYRIN